MPSIAGIAFDVLSTEGPTPWPQVQVSREDGVGGSVAVLRPALPTQWVLVGKRVQAGLGLSGLDAYAGTVVTLVCPAITDSVWLVSAVDQTPMGIFVDGEERTLLTVRIVIEIWP